MARADRIEAAQETERRQLARQVTTWIDEDGMLVIRGRLTPEAGAVVQRALEAAADHLFKESAGAAKGDQCVDEVTAGQRRADALARVAESALAGGLDRGTAGDRYQVVVHVDAATLQPDSDGVANGGQAVVEVSDSGVWISAETSQRLACDASVVVMRHGSDGTVLDVGRKTRTIPPAIRRALLRATARVVRAWRSRRNTVPRVGQDWRPPGTRFDATDSKTRNRPSWVRPGLDELPLPAAPSGLTEASSILPELTCRT